MIHRHACGACDKFHVWIFEIFDTSNISNISNKFDLFNISNINDVFDIFYHHQLLPDFCCAERLCDLILCGEVAWFIVVWRGLLDFFLRGEVALLGNTLVYGPGFSHCEWVPSSGCPLLWVFLHLGFPTSGCFPHLGASTSFFSVILCKPFLSSENSEQLLLLLVGLDSLCSPLLVCLIGTLWCVCSDLVHKGQSQKGIPLHFPVST